MQQIDIHYYTATGGEKSVIPVTYDVEDHKDECMQIIHCTVGLPQNETPSWLHSRKFELITHIREGIQLVDYVASANHELKTLDAEFFRYKVYSEIVFREQRRLSGSLAEC